ncbi:zeta toxin family protein [Streptomyces sp. MBT65]|uniref:zeta toxin family protein n=1 Tax=Streptomyces sp. MBT65 TaxID=1488395 RepID=UPI001F39BFE7|nr:zeta toxin family protein [Streptomyces sp. MBT65]
MSWENHDSCPKGLLATLAVIESEQFADRATVVRRDGTVLYANDPHPAGQLAAPYGSRACGTGGAGTAVDRARDRVLPPRADPRRPARPHRTGRRGPAPGGAARQ